MNDELRNLIDESSFWCDVIDAEEMELPNGEIVTRAYVAMRNVDRVVVIDGGTPYLADAEIRVRLTIPPSGS